MPWRKMLHARDDLLRTARRLLAQDSTRVLTLTGLPGVGRTSMARALVGAAPQHHEVPFVDARRATQPGALSRIVLEAAALSDLIVVDDADAAPDAAQALARVLATQRDAQLIVTASAPLHLSAESVVRVPALPEPTCPMTLRRMPSSRRSVSSSTLPTAAGPRSGPTGRRWRRSPPSAARWVATLVPS